MPDVLDTYIVRVILAAIALPVAARHSTAHAPDDEPELWADRSLRYADALLRRAGWPVDPDCGAALGQGGPDPSGS